MFKIMYFIAAATVLFLCVDALSSGFHKRAAPYSKKSLKARVHHESAQSPSQYLTNATKKFVVNGTALPEVDFDIGESYAGTLSIDSNPHNENQLYFWFFPSKNPAASNEITVWLNGGPGCSSLAGLIQENGPFMWQSGTYKPQPNPFSWTNLTNMVYVDQPLGTGFSTYSNGTPASINSEKQVSAQFAGFWKNFMSTFNLTGRHVYITGESYAGQYIPYIADYMLDQNETEYYNVKGIQINDPSIADDAVLVQAPAVPALHHFAPVFALNNTFTTYVNERYQSCGYASLIKEGLTFPPKGKFTIPNGTAPGCELWQAISAAATYVNPCFNAYHLTDFCPFLWDIMGEDLAIGPNDYFNRTDVQKAINAPPTNYLACSEVALGLDLMDTSPPSSYGPLPRVIEKTNNVIVASGLLDYVIMTNGTLIALNNMTFNGAQGFSSAPSGHFFVPYNPEIEVVIEEAAAQSFPLVPVGLVAGGGVMGTTHTERGLTWVTVNLAGHQIPQYAPSAAYRQLEFLLGRIANLTVQGGFTTQRRH